MAPKDDDPAATCPVDHATRAAWLEKARESGQARHLQIPSASGVATPGPTKTRPLSQDRERSSIPRADICLSSTTPNTEAASTSSTCTSTPTSKSVIGVAAGAANWIYPSEKMFFDAMRRKDYKPRVTDMAVIVPLHNAVNERAWAEIRAWERRMPWARTANSRCGGPRLRSFAGDASRASPRARWNALLGYKMPFDRHDWLVERCEGDGGVEYVIDFYEGKGSLENGKVNFYLDVRPKLNSWEGWKMRISSWIGLY